MTCETDAARHRAAAKRREFDALMSDDSLCVWAEFGGISDDETDVSTKCGRHMYEYEGDDLHWEVGEGDKCPFCGRSVVRRYGWIA